MKREQLVLSVCVVVALTVPWPGSAAAGEKEQDNASPKQLLLKAQAAEQKGDVKALLDCLSVEAAEALAGATIMNVETLKVGHFNSLKKVQPNEDPAKLKQQVEATFKALEQVLTKHGVTSARLVELTGKAKGIVSADPPPTDMKPVYKLYGAEVKDRVAFLTEMKAALAKMNKTSPVMVPPTLPLFDGELVGVEDNADTIKLTVARQRDGKKQTVQIELRRVGAAWRMDLPREFYGKGAAFTPSPGEGSSSK